VAESKAAAAIFDEALVHIVLAVGAGPVLGVAVAGVCIIAGVGAATAVLARGRQA
jgi:hypothetical protein